MAGPSSTSSLADRVVLPNPARVAVGLSAQREAVHVLTKESAEYTFPDMDGAELRKVLPESRRVLADMPSLSMVNVSGSVLIIPFRIIKHIYIGEDLVWVCPA